MTGTSSSSGGTEVAVGDTAVDGSEVVGDTGVVSLMVMINITALVVEGVTLREVVE